VQALKGGSAAEGHICHPTGIVPGVAEVDVHVVDGQPLRLVDL
jgi:hypothetical protein